MEEEACDQGKFHFVGKLFSELHEMLNQLSDLEKIKVEYEKEISRRMRIEEDFQKTRTSLEEQLAERGAALERMTADRQRIEEESYKIRTKFKERLAEREADINRITAEFKHEARERQRIEELSYKIRTKLEERLTEREAEIGRITAARQREVQEWKQILDTLRNRLNETFE
jgi:chromosome segregation ATPase